MLRGSFYCVEQPLWEGYDEWAHFACIQHIVEHGRLPTRHDTVSREVRESLELAPLPFRFREWKLPHVVLEDYWRLPKPERAALRRRFAAVQPGLASVNDSAVPLYEAQQPPLYYVLLSFPYRLLRDTELSTRLLFLRLFGLLLASLLIPISFSTARAVLGAAVSRLAIPIVISLIPGLMVDVCRVGNEGLAMVLISLVVLNGIGLARSGPDEWRWTKLGALLGAALLTKAYALVFIPFLIVVAALCAMRVRRVRETAVGLALALFLASAMSGWWYVNTWRITHTISGEQIDVAAARFTLGQKLAAVTAVPWRDALDQAAFSHIWTGGWTFLGIRTWMYRLVELVAMIACLGLLLLAGRIVSRFRKRGALGRFGAGAVTVGSAYLLMCAALGYNVLVVWMAKGYAATCGWYLYAVVIPEAVLLALGLTVLTGRTWSTFAVAGGALICAGLDLYTVNLVSVPYYTGMTFHKASGFVGAFHGSDLSRLGLAEVVRRVAGNTMGPIAPAAVVVLWIAYLASTLALTALVLRLAGKAAGPHPKLLAMRLKSRVLACLRGEPAARQCGSSIVTYRLTAGAVTT